MSAPAQMNGNGQAPPPIVPEDPMQGVNEMLGAIRLCASKARGAQSAAEAKDFAAAALSFAQAIIVLDPSLSQGGTPLAHDLALEEVRGETQQNDRPDPRRARRSAGARSAARTRCGRRRRPPRRRPRRSTSRSTARAGARPRP
jgi:hypothetical protein